MMNPEDNSPVSSVENMRERKLSSIVFELQKLFPEKSEKIKSVSDSFIKECHQEILKANRDLEKVGLKPLNEKELRAIELFYQLKAEKQLRDSFSVSVKKIVYQFLEKIDMLSDWPEEKGDDILEANEGNLGLTKEEAEQYKFAILASLPKNELDYDQQRRLAAYLTKRHNGNEGAKSLPAISLNRLLKIVKKNPALLEQFASDFEHDVAIREGYTKRQISESVAMLSALFVDLKKEERVLDLCTGTGVISTVVKNLGYSVRGIDLNEEYLRVGRVYDTILQKKRGKKTEKHLSQGDILESELPNSDVWVAKHPCAPGIALPDRIIQRFAQESTARRLYLLTCCADKSVHCCPAEYKDLGITTEGQWDNSCSVAVDAGLNVDPKEINQIQSAYRNINEVRIKYIRDVLRFDAELIEIPGTIMNQMIIVKKISS